MGSLHEVWRAARIAWPGVDVSEPEFSRWVEERCENASELATVHTRDLYLACACGRGDAAALAAFDTAYAGTIDAALASVRMRDDHGDDIRQRLRAKLFVGAKPKIGSYRGGGELGAWVRAATIREALDVRRTLRRDVPTEDPLAELDEVPLADLDARRAQAAVPPGDEARVRICARRARPSPTARSCVTSTSMVPRSTSWLESNAPTVPRSRAGCATSAASKLAQRNARAPDGRASRWHRGRRVDHPAGAEPARGQPAGARRAVSVAACLDEHGALDYLDGRGDRDSMVAHLVGCGECRELLIELARAQGDERTDVATSETAPASPKALRADASLDDTTEATRAHLATLGLIEVDASLYEGAHELARGGMGRIRVARDRRLGRMVAVKEVLVQDGALVQRFEREARLTARLQHPSIVSVYEAGTLPTGEPPYAMPLIKAKLLDAAINARGTPWIDGSSSCRT